MADCASDHNPVVCKLAIRLRKLKSTHKSPQLHYSYLQTDKDMRNQYNIAVQNRPEVLRDDKSISVWDCFKESVALTAIEIILKKNKLDNNKWITAEILDLMQERQEIVNKESTEYKAIDKQIHKMLKKKKEIWMNRDCEEI